MNKIIALLMIAAFAGGILVGCEKEPPPPPPKAVEKPREPTPEELAAEMRSMIQPMKDITVTLKGQTGFGSGGQGAQDVLSPVVKDDVIGKLKGARAKNAGTDNGKAAINMVSNDISECIKVAREQQRWYLTLGLIEAYETLMPGSTKFNRQKQEAEIRWYRPRVMIRGFFTDRNKDNETSVFVEVTNKRTGQVSQLQVRPGEEFEGLRFIKVLGEEKGIRLEYLAMPGTTWDVMMYK